MFKSFLANIGLLAVFLGLLVLPLGAFGLLRGPTSFQAVLSATSANYGGNLTFGQGSHPILLQEVSATAFSGQRASYADVLGVTNTQAVPMTYKIRTIRSTAAAGISSRWFFKNSQPQITLQPGEVGSVTLEVTSTSNSPTLRLEYLVAIED